MFGKLIATQIKLMPLAVLPGILGGIACFIGPKHHALIRAWIGVLIGFAIQQRFMLPAIKDALKAGDKIFNNLFEGDN